jgi:hypothetical protein
MATELPMRGLNTNPAQNLPPQALQTAILSFYTTLARMPHIPVDSVSQPPPSGWKTIDIEALRARGKSDQAIDFLRHLPYLTHGSRLTPNSTAVDFSAGETYKLWQEQLLETPEHVIWLAEADTRDGHYLLLDTLAGKGFQ